MTIPPRAVWFRERCWLSTIPLIASLSLPLSTLTHAQECRSSPSDTARRVAVSLIRNQNLSELPDRYFNPSLRSRLPPSRLRELADSLTPADPTLPPILRGPVLEQIDASRVPQQSGVVGPAVQVQFGVISGRSPGMSELVLLMQCVDGRWLVAGIRLGPYDH